MADPDTISQQKALLVAHRRSLAVLLQQAALRGATDVQLATVNDIRAARSEIQRIKAYLHDQGVIIKDDPNDEGPDILDIQDQEASLCAANAPTAASKAADSQWPVGVVTFLFAVIVQSGKHWSQESARMYQAMKRYDEIVGMCAAQHQGFIVEPRDEDDSCLVVFDQATDAILAAGALQRACAAETWPTSLPIRICVALHTGEADLRNNHYDGLAVKLCARLGTLGHSGQTLLSQATYEMTRTMVAPDITLRHLGDCYFEDFDLREQIFQLALTDQPADYPPLKCRDISQTNLATQMAPLIGRDQDVASLKEWVLREDMRLVTLTGPGGVGKTSLSLHVAAAVLDHFADGVYFVSLADISDPALIPVTIARALGLAEAGDLPIIDSLLEYLHNRRMLLVLDNFEHLSEGVSIVKQMLNAAPTLHLLVTTRTALRLSNEQVFPVTPLALPNMTIFPPQGTTLVTPPHIAPEQLSTLENCPSVALFVQRARAVKPDFKLTSTNGRVVAQICLRLDGLPLAIELAAARIRLLPPGELLKRLDKRLSLLTNGPNDLPDRQRTLRAAIEWSYKLLTPMEQTLLAFLAVFVGGCTLEAAELISNYLVEREIDVLNGLMSLVDSNLLQSEEAGDEVRYVMLGTIHEYAAELLSADPAAESVRRQHALYYLALAENAEPQLRGAQQDTWFDRLEQEHGNLRAALSWSLAGGAPELAARLSGALWRFWEVRGYFTEGRAWLERVLAARDQAIGNDPTRTEAQQLAARVKVLNGSAMLARDQSDYNRARERLTESLALCRKLGDQASLAWVLNSLGAIASEQGDYAEAEPLHQESLALCRTLGDKQGIAWALDNLGAIAGEQGDGERAESFFAESLTLRRELGHKQGIATALLNLGFMALLKGNLTRASKLLEESLEICRELEDKQGAAEALLNLGVAALRRDEVGQAAALLKESLLLSQELGDTSNIAECLEGLAGVAEAHGLASRAAQLWGAAEALRESIGVPLTPVERGQYELAVATTRIQHNADIWNLAWREGRLLNRDQAIAEALKSIEGIPYEPQFSA